MCDTLVAVGRATRDGTVVFGKNSDRSPNESQPLVKHPRMSHEEPSVRCQNIEIPQVPVTYEHIGSRPYWLWGYEHGVNEFGVVIGNLGVRSKEPYETPADRAGLIGMDLVRLGLERGKTSREAMEVITSLLEERGAGFCESPNVAKYHNNYMIADPDEAWVLETAGRYWVAKRVVDGVYHEGNMYSIQTEWDECHRDLVSHAVEMNWCESEEDFNFAKVYTNFIGGHTPIAMVRNRRGEQLLREHEGEITPETMREILRDHLEGSFLESFWTPGENFYFSICCHEKPWGGGQTAASMVVELDRELPEPLKASCWASMTAPCTSVFMPFYPKSLKVSEKLSIADGSYSDSSPWWVFKRLQRHTERNYHLLGEFTRNFWSGVEKGMMEQQSKVERNALRLIRDGDMVKALEHLQKYVDHHSDECVEQARRLNKTLHDIEETAPSYRDLREAHLDSLNKQAGIEI